MWNFFGALLTSVALLEVNINAMSTIHSSEIAFDVNPGIDDTVFPSYFCNFYGINAGGDIHYDAWARTYQADPLKEVDDMGYELKYDGLKRINRSSKQDERFYQTERTGESGFNYTIPICKDGQYELVLKFSENYMTASDMRKFNVAINEMHDVLNEFDVYSLVGMSTAYDISINFTVKDGILSYQEETSSIKNSVITISFSKGSIGKPFLNALHLSETSQESSWNVDFPNDPCKDPNIIFSVNAGGHLTITWGSNQVCYDEDPLLSIVDEGYVLDFSQRIDYRVLNFVYKSVRYTDGDSFGYDIYIEDEGDYVIYMKFAESYYMESKKRIFNVVINSELTIVQDLDIYEKVGYDTPYDIELQFKLTNGCLTFANENASEICLGGNKMRVDFVKGTKGYPQLNAMLVAKGTLKNSPYKDEIFEIPYIGYVYNESIPYAVNIGGFNELGYNGIEYNMDPYITTSDETNILTMSNVDVIDGNVYQSQRLFYKDHFTYNASIYKDGSYVLVLQFSENYYTSENQRLFHVYVNEILVIENLDIFKEAKGRGKSYNLYVHFEIENETFRCNNETVQYEGKVSVRFAKGAKDFPVANGLYIVKGTLKDVPSAKEIKRNDNSVVYAINAGGYLCTIGSYTIYDEDPLFKVRDNGNTAVYSKSKKIKGVKDGFEVLYQTERFSQGSNFRYDIPVNVDGDYEMTLHFCENYFTGPNERIFDVVVNGVHKIIENCDIFKNVGASTAYDIKIPFSINGSIFLYKGENSMLNERKMQVEFQSVKESAVLNGLVVMRDNNI